MAVDPRQTLPPSRVLNAGNINLVVYILTLTQCLIPTRSKPLVNLLKGYLLGSQVNLFLGN